MDSKKNEPAPRRLVSARLDEDVIFQLQHLAEYRDESLSATVNRELRARLVEGA